ncbi:hypothetical protein GCM10023084_06490 [Streptomyces lacrimifluminis]|uniref:Uncharacterized protein n=1 Tax=Streptomyces lacrimifluminis TaxID=1500077 RepID=A0A917KTV3_9ACTN|nr:hypothetical protein GCM10012282_23380 [Streptomyces lacrimifluminis]
MKCRSLRGGKPDDNDESAGAGTGSESPALPRASADATTSAERPKIELPSDALNDALAWVQAYVDATMSSPGRLSRGALNFGGRPERDKRAFWSDGPQQHGT